MKKLYLAAGFLIISTSYAYQTLNQFMQMEDLRQELAKETLVLQKQIDARLPVTSKAKPGEVRKTELPSVNLSNPIFIIGDDPSSRQWLKKNKDDLEKRKAIGFVTNIRDSNHLHDLQKMTNAPLLPANVDDLLEVFHVSNYPLIIVEGMLWQ